MLQSDPPRAPEGWVREITQRKDSGRKDIVYHKPEGVDPAQPALILRSTSEAARWLQSNPSCGLTLDAFDFVVRKGDKVSAGGFSCKPDGSDEDMQTQDVSADSADPAESAPCAPSSSADRGGGAGGGKGGAAVGQGEQGASKKSKKACTAVLEATASKPARADTSGAEERADPAAPAPSGAAKKAHEPPQSGANRADEDTQVASVGSNSAGAGAAGGERQKRERKQTAFYDPQKMEGDGPLHASSSATDSPAVASAARQAQPPKKPSCDISTGNGGDTKSSKKRRVVLGGLAAGSGGGSGKGDGSEERSGSAGAVKVFGSADAGGEEMNPCSACEAANKGVAQCFSQGHLFVKQDGSRPHSCASCRQRNKGALHCFKRGHMHGLLRCPTVDDIHALSQASVSTPTQVSRASGEHWPDGATQARPTDGGGKKNSAPSNVSETSNHFRTSGAPPASTSPANTTAQAHNQPGADGDADGGELGDGSGRRTRLGRGSTERYAAAGSYRNSTYTTTASHRSARPSFRESRDREKEREARERGLDMDAEHLPPAAQPIALWETVINRLSYRCSAAYLRDKGKIEDAAGGDGEDAAASPSTAAVAATVGKRFLSAAAYGDAETAQRLLREGVDVNARDELQHTALHHAAAAGDLAMSRLLLDAGADVSVRGVDGDDACHMAASQGHEEVLQLLMDKGASIDVFNRERLTARHVVNLVAVEIAYLAQQAAADEDR